MYIYVSSIFSCKGLFCGGKAKIIKEMISLNGEVNG